MTLAAATPPTASPDTSSAEAPKAGPPDFLASLRGVNSLSDLLHSANRTEKMVQAWLDEQEAAPTRPPIRDIHTAAQTIRHLTSIKKTMLQVAAHPEKFSPPKAPPEQQAKDEEHRQRILAALREYRAEHNISKAIDRAAATLKPSGPTPSWDDVIQAMVAHANDQAFEDVREMAAQSGSLRPEATCSSSVPSAPALSQGDDGDEDEDDSELYAWPIDSILADPDDPDEDEDDPEEDDLPQWRPSVFKDPKPTPAPPTTSALASALCGTGILPVIPSVAPTPTSERGSLSALRTPHSELDIPSIPAIHAVPVCPTLYSVARDVIARELLAAQTHTTTQQSTPAPAPSPTSIPSSPSSPSTPSIPSTPTDPSSTPYKPYKPYQSYSPDPSDPSPSSPICPSSFVLCPSPKPPPT